MKDRKDSLILSVTGDQEIGIFKQLLSGLKKRRKVTFPPARRTGKGQTFESFIRIVHIGYNKRQDADQHISAVFSFISEIENGAFLKRKA